ncbi:hypothetical protein Barb6XT_02235 [Bacteroidales bacterium Barb6XT]|nr:hypothetical protein Barb6XT_02235 [Bacteroidales bacterium Barb6XT]
MDCPKCSSEKKIKADFTRECKECGYNYTVGTKSDSMKKQALYGTKQRIRLELDQEIRERNIRTLFGKQRNRDGGN